MAVLLILATHSSANEIESFTNLDNATTVREKAEPEWVPPGFEGLNASQETVIDVFFGGYFLTSALTRFTKREVTILEVEKIVDRLNDLSDPDRVRELLAIPLYSNFEKICKSQYSVDCGRLDTTSVDIIFDISKLRIDLFISSTLLLTRSLDQLAFLPPSDAGFSVLDDLSIFASGSSERSANYNIANSTLIAYAENRLFMRSNYTDTDNFGVDSIFLQQEFEGRSYQAGIFRGNAGNFIFMRDYQFLGAALENSLATRIDLNFSLGNEIEVFLDSRSHVEIYKDDRLIRSQYYEAGNQILDTRGLPHGSYDIELHITDSANRRRKEIRFFSKTSRLPPADQSLYFVQAGEVLLADEGRIFPTGTGEKFVRAGYSKRLTATFGGNIGVSRNQESTMLETGFFKQGKKYEMQSIFAYDSYGVAAVDFRFRYRFGKGEVIVSSRKIWNQDIRVDEISQIGDALVQSSISGTFRTSYGVGNLFYRFNERGGRDSEENYGVRWSLSSLFGLPNVSGNFEVSRNNNSNFLLMSLNYRFQKNQWTHTASTRYQLDEGLEGDAGPVLLGSVASSWMDDSSSANRYLVSLRADHQPENSLESKIDARTSLGQGTITLKYSPDDEVMDYDAS